MNDIERLAAAIKKSRQDDQTLASANESEKENVDIELPTLGNGQFGATPDGEIKRVTNDACHESLLHERGTDVGLSASEDPDLNGTPDLSSIPVVGSGEPFVSESMPYIELPIEKLNAEGFITPLTGRGLLTEQYRRIKRPLLKNVHDGDSSTLNNNVIMVTSSVSGEGKTYTAINLAMSLALEKDRTVLLIDADVLKNSASGVLEVGKDKPGLTDVLSGDVLNPSDVILRTNVSNLTYLPSGTSQQYANELLSSTRMKKLFEELSSRYQDRIIVLDCPPILQTNEASVLTDYAGQVVFVVAEGETSQSFVSEALNQIPADSYVGIILNKSHRRLLGNDYGYTYYYG